MAKKTKSKKKGNVAVVTLQCIIDGKHRQQTLKNTRNTTEPLELRKYNPNLRKHTIHREVKVKK
jgi:large subunit ribosomal protein L33